MLLESLCAVMLFSSWVSLLSLGKTVGEDEVTAELLKLGGSMLRETIVKVCQEKWFLLTEVAPGAEVHGRMNGAPVLWPHYGNIRATSETRTRGGGLLLCLKALS